MLRNKHWTELESKVIKRVHKSQYTTADIERLLAADSRAAHKLGPEEGRVEYDEDYDSAGNIFWTVTIEVHTQLTTEDSSPAPAEREERSDER